MKHSDKETSPQIERSHEKLAAFLRTRHMRQTPERFAILNRVMSLSSHFSVEDFHSQLEAEGSFHVSKATVYNTLQVLLEAGIVRRHNFEGPAEYERIDLDGHNHLHLVCTRCGSVSEAPDDELDETISRLRYTGFVPSYFSLYVYGLCAKCRRKK